MTTIGRPFMATKILLAKLMALRSRFRAGSAVSEPWYKY